MLESVLSIVITAIVSSVVIVVDTGDNIADIVLVHKSCFCRVFLVFEHCQCTTCQSMLVLGKR